MGCSRTSKELMVVWVGWRQQQDQTWRRLTRSFHLGDRRSTQLISEVNAAVKQCHAGPSPSRFGLFHLQSYVGRHSRTQVSTLESDSGTTRLVWCVLQTNIQPRKVGAGECATLANSKAHTKSLKFTVGRNLCSKLSGGGDDLDQSIVRIDDLERF